MDNLELSNENGRVVVSPGIGASLRSLRVNIGGVSRELLSGGSDEPHDPTSMEHGTGSFMMAPWVNRIRDGKLIAPDGEHSLPVNSGLHAIHGLVREREWEIVERSQSSATLRIELQEPWPYKGHIIYRLSLDGASFTQTLEVHASDGEREFPAGVGWHPWFARLAGSGELKVQSDVGAQWELDSTVTPTGKLEETPLTLKLRDGGSFGVGEVDGCFTLNPDGQATVRWPDVALRITGSPEITHVMLYSPEGSVCVEPQTTAVNADQLAAAGHTNTGTRMAAPGRPLIASTTWAWSQA